MKNSLIAVKSIDGFSVETMISAPDKQPNGVVIYVNSSGPNSHNIKRKNPDGQVWYYHVIIAKELTERGLVYCRYSARGVIDGDKEPCIVKFTATKLRKGGMIRDSVFKVKPKEPTVCYVDLYLLLQTAFGVNPV